jgi:N-methylhydantoinase A
MKRLRVASDVGGTFTDSIAYNDETGKITVSKVPTTPNNRAVGTAEGLRAALSLQKMSGASVGYVGHGMTTTTNAVIQRSGARTAFLTNKGFRDILLIGRQDRPSLFDVDAIRPAPLVPRDLCFTVAGRTDANGDIIEPLDRDGLNRIVERLREREVEAVAIMFLHSYANPSQELEAKAILETLQGVFVCASTEIVTEFREFERGSTAVLNAYLRPVMETYLESLEELLRGPNGGLEIEADVPIMVMDAAGGLMTLDGARNRPVHTVLSGPAGGVVGSVHIAAMADIHNIITMDIGGTSTDISLILNGSVAITRNAKLETVPIRLPVIDINAIGAGGGSIAWIDDGGALRVGPMSAEAFPGPACYSRGGTTPTVTDANIVLGRFDSNTKLGGNLAMNLGAAERTIKEHIADPLGLTVVEAAAGILRVAHANIVRGIRTVSVERGFDPREFALVPFGGAGPMHGTPVARELGMPTILVPTAPGILCALGQLVSDLRHDLVMTSVGICDDIGLDKFKTQCWSLAERATTLLDADHVPESRRDVKFRAELRYRGQSYELEVAVDSVDETGWKAISERFHQLHEEKFGYSDRAAQIEIVALGATAVGRTDPPTLPILAVGQIVPPTDALIGTRQVYFEADGLSGAVKCHDAHFFRRDGLLAGNVIEGPAVIEEVSATTVLYPGDRAIVHQSGSLIVAVGP